MPGTNTLAYSVWQLIIFSLDWRLLDKLVSSNVQATCFKREKIAIAKRSSLSYKSAESEKKVL